MLPLEKSMIIKSPGIKQVIQSYCQGVVIEFEGLKFYANLIVLESKGLDVILGMDWLTTNIGFIDCFNRTVILTHHHGKKIKVSAKERQIPRRFQNICPHAIFNFYISPDLNLIIRFI